MTTANRFEYQGIIENLREYNLKKIIKDQLKVINPLLAKNETDVKIHLDKSVSNGLITESELEFLKIKMALGRMCLELEEVLDGIYVTMLFYDKKNNSIFHGACPSGPATFFDFFAIINEQGILDENCASCGRAIFTQEVVQTDIETSPLWSDFLKDHAISYGFRSCTSIPFYTSSGTLAGTYAHYSDKPNHVFTQDEVEMIQEKTSMFSNEIQKISEHLHEYTKVGETGLTI